MLPFDGKLSLCRAISLSYRAIFLLNVDDSQVAQEPKIECWSPVAGIAYGLLRTKWVAKTAYRVRGLNVKQFKPIRIDS